MPVKINDNSIVILNHRITIDDMIDEIHYLCNNAHYNDQKIADSIYFEHLNKDDRDKINNFREQKLYDAAQISPKIKPLFSNNNIKYQSYNNKLYCISIKSILDDYYNNINCINDFMIYINIFYKVLKFKIKQERITKNIYNDLQLTNKKFIELENKYYDIKSTLKSYEKQINKMCDCIDYIYNSNDTSISKNNIINNSYNDINNEFKIIKNRQFYIIIFVIIATFINILLYYKII